MNFSFNSGLRFGNVVENFSLNTEMIPSNTFEYMISGDYLTNYADIFRKTTIITKNFNNIYELTNVPVHLNIKLSSENTTRYLLNFKAEDVTFKCKLSVYTQDTNNITTEPSPDNVTLDSTDKCKGFTYRSTDMMCWLKEGGELVSKNDNLISSVKQTDGTYKNYADYDVSGGHFASFDNISMDDCKKECNNIEGFQNINNTDTSKEVYLEKMLPEDMAISDTQPETDSVRDVVPDDLKLVNLETVKPKEPEFKFFTDKNYTKLYIQVFSNRGSDASDGWLALNGDNKFIISESPTNASDFYTLFEFILPKFIAYKLEGGFNGIPIKTQLNSDQFYYSEEALTKGVKNSNLGDIQIIIQGYDLYTSQNNSTNSPAENKDTYQLLFLDIEGVYSKFCLMQAGNAIDGKKIYITESSDDFNREPVICKLFKDIYSNGIYIYVLLKDSGITDTDILLQNKIWVAIGDDGKLQLVENIYNSINMVNYLTNSNIIVESFTNNTNNANNISTNVYNFPGYKIISNPNATAAEVTPESCAAYCYNRNPEGNVGAYFNRNSEDFNCKCYSNVTLTETQDTADESILFGSMIMDHRNNSKISRTLTTDDATECNTSCLVDENGLYTDENVAFTFDSNKTEENCTCHTSTEITYNDSEGKITGPVQTIEEDIDEDYIPLQKYFETSSLFNFFRQPGMRTLLIMFKVITVSVALILYSYYSHYDMPVVQAVKFIFIAIFSELYLMYGFIKLVLTPYRKGIHEV